MPSPSTKPRGSQVLVQDPVWRRGRVLMRRQGPPLQRVFMTSITSGCIFEVPQPCVLLLFHEDSGSPRGLGTSRGPSTPPFLGMAGISWLVGWPSLRVRPEQWPARCQPSHGTSRLLLGTFTGELTGFFPHLKKRL